MSYKLTRGIFLKTDKFYLKPLKLYRIFGDTLAGLFVEF